MSPKCVWSEPIFYLENQIKEHFTRSFQLLHSALVAHWRIMLTSSESDAFNIGLFGSTKQIYVDQLITYYSNSATKLTTSYKKENSF